VFDLMERAIGSPVTVLLQGETGTGKELIAAAIHYNGPRKDKAFVTVNCAALPETLLESELFGYRKGAFTGATADKKGLFEVADGGTMLLDEIGESGPATQAKLLRVLQNGEILPLGGTQPQRVDVRVISATNRNLELEVKRQRFREDLYYRLNVFPIHMPPLRERKEDIPLLATHLLRRTRERFGREVEMFTAEALDVLTHYAWPGNVRELENEIERAVTLSPGGLPIGIDLLSEKLWLKKPARVPAGATITSLKRARALFEEEYLAEVLRQHGGNASRAAKALGISRVMLQTKIKEYGLRGN
jgi:transcriptional regulator with PAS, ATPase and Fis domain